MNRLTTLWMRNIFYSHYTCRRYILHNQCMEYNLQLKVNCNTWNPSTSNTNIVATSNTTCTIIGIKVWSAKPNPSKCQSITIRVKVAILTITSGNIRTYRKNILATTSIRFNIHDKLDCLYFKLQMQYIRPTTLYETDSTTRLPIEIE